jgi:D-glycero-alpha-D-manno-heptose-7-phosphate kinase
MIVSSAPLRISFSGGGSDYKEHYIKHGGAVFGSAINKRVYVFVNPLSKFSNENIRFTYRVTESVSNLQDLKHPVVREALKIFNIKGNINIATLSDLPGNTGLGSSSAFTVALINALAKYTKNNLGLDEVWRLAYSIEREILGESGGVQDHLHATFGGLRYYELSKNKVEYSDNLITEPLNNIFKKRALLIRIGQTRKSEISANETILSIHDPVKVLEIKKSADIASRSFNEFSSTDLDDGRYNAICDGVNQNWQSKINFQNINDQSLLEKISYLKSLGGISFKLCGAGSSGFILAFFDGTNLETSLSEQSEQFELDSRGVETFEY